VISAFKLVMRIISALFTIVLLYFAVTFVQIWLTGHEHSKENAQAILVFAPRKTRHAVAGAHGSPRSRARVVPRCRAPWIAVTEATSRRQLHEAGVSARTSKLVCAKKEDPHGAGNDTCRTC